MTKLTRRGLAALLAATTLLPRRPQAQAPADAQAIVSRIEAYLNSIRSLAAGFSQINPDGSADSGRVYVDRERAAMLFDYDPPSQITLIAPGDWRLIFMDGSIKQQNVLPVNDTPLGFLLAPQINLGQNIILDDVRRQQGEIQILVSRANARDQGRVLLAFIERPMELRRWAVTDPQGLTTVIILENLQLNIRLDRSLFVYRDPKIFGWPRG